MSTALRIGEKTDSSGWTESAFDVCPLTYERDGGPTRCC